MGAFAELDSIFNRTKDALMEFMGIITPIIENAKDDHERLFWHHIYEEEEHRSDRLDLLMPKIKTMITDEGDITDNRLKLVHLLQDISLEKFGLHNFLEHLDLFLFQFKETEAGEKVQILRDITNEDYQQMKVLMDRLNQDFQGEIQFKTSIPTDEKESNPASVKVETYWSESSQTSSQTKLTMKKRLTVGSLKQR